MCEFFKSAGAGVVSQRGFWCCIGAARDGGVVLLWRSEGVDVQWWVVVAARDCAGVGE